MPFVNGEHVRPRGELVGVCAADADSLDLEDESVRLTSTEYRLLEELARHPGQTLPHGLLLERVWGDGWAGDPGYLKVFVRRLRRKLGDDARQPRYIQTDWGIGYRFVAPAKGGPPSADSSLGGEPCHGTSARSSARP